MNNLDYILNRSRDQNLSEFSLESSGLPSELTQELEILNRQSETAIGAADQVSIANKILNLAAKIIALEKMRLFFSRFLLLMLALNTAYADSLNCSCRVVKITDGDTTVNVLDQSSVKHKIRLMGIDALERRQPFGLKSKQNLSAMVAGQFVEVEYNKYDRYGRIIGKLLLDGQDINLKQIKQGFAWHYKAYQGEQSKLDRAL